MSIYDEIKRFNLIQGLAQAANPKSIQIRDAYKSQYDLPTNTPKSNHPGPIGNRLASGESKQGDESDFS